MKEMLFAINDDGGIEERRERIIRCRDCKFAGLEYGNRGQMFCRWNCCSPLPVEPDDFCSCGEPREVGV